MRLTWVLLLLAVLPSAGCRDAVSGVEVNDEEAANIRRAMEDQLGAVGSADATESEALVNDGWATLKGRFVLDGKAPTPSLLTINADPNFCGTFGLKDEGLVVSGDGGIKNVVVWIRTKKVPVHPDLQGIPTEPVEVDNKGCRYEPHVVAMRAGQVLKVGNPDSVPHNVKWASKSTSGGAVMIAAGNDASITSLKKPERQPFPITCAVHPWMEGFVMVQDHPYFAVTGEDGSFEIKNVPAGIPLQIQVWHESLKKFDSLKVNGEAEAWKRGVTKLDPLTADETLELKVEIPN